MREDVKSQTGTRQRPTLRDERAALTRTRIAEAARRCFAQTGYGATTLQAIAGEAGVAVQTVYAVYSSKAGILRALRASLVNQPAAERLYGEALAVAPAEPGQALDLFARSIRGRWEAGADVVRAHAEAAATNAALRAEVEVVLERRRGGIRQLAGALAAGLAPHVDVARAAAIMDVLTLPEIYSELTLIAGWSPDAFEAWLARALRRELLAPGA